MATLTAVDAIHWVKARLKFLRSVIPAPVRKRIYSFFAVRTIARLPSRVYMTKTLVPALAAAGVRKLLVIGTQSYNRPLYRACKAAGMAVYSIDFDPAAAAYGAPDGHFVGDVRDVDQLAVGHRFDGFSFNGVIGFGINTPDEVDTTLSSFQAIAAPGAVLSVGWNPGIGDDAAAAVRSRLTPMSLGDISHAVEFPAFGAAQPTPHRYETFRLTPAGGEPQ